MLMRYPSRRMVRHVDHVLRVSPWGRATRHIECRIDSRAELRDASEILIRLSAVKMCECQSCVGGGSVWGFAGEPWAKTCIVDRRKATERS